MKIQKPAMAGTLESSDCMVTVTSEGGESVRYEIESIVMERYGDAIERAARETVESLGVTSGRITIQDRGALDCVIAARVETAIRRAAVKEVVV